MRRAHGRDVFDHVAAAVDDDAPASDFAAEPFLLRELHPFLAPVLVAGEADDLCGHIAAGVIAPVFGFFVQSFDLEGHRARGCLGRDLARKHGEVVATGGDARRKSLRRRFENARERGELGGRRLELAGKRPQRFHRC